MGIRRVRHDVPPAGSVTLAVRLRRLPLFDLWPGARALRRRSDHLEWYAWVGAALLVALALPVAVATALVARESLAGTAAEQQREPRAQPGPESGEGHADTVPT